MGSIGKRVRQMSLLLVVRPHRAQSIPPAFFCARLIPMRLHPPLNQSPAVSPRPTLVSTPHNVNYTDCTKGYPWASVGTENRARRD